LADVDTQSNPCRAIWPSLLFTEDQLKHGAEPAKLLPRTETAKRLGVSTSTVRRYRGDKLHPIRGADGVNRFDAKAVAELATSLLNDSGGKPPRKPQRNAAAAAHEVKRTEGEIAAEVFERLEQRQSLAEIVIGVRVPPDLVRELHRQWQIGLIEVSSNATSPCSRWAKLSRGRSDTSASASCMTSLRRFRPAQRA
jgi:hypothetical protein